MFKLFLLQKAGNEVPLELSYSKINAYHFCPWKYKLVYVDGMRAPSNPFIALGQSIHKTLEHYHKNNGATLDKLLECYNEYWVNDGFDTPQQTMAFFEKGQKMLEHYFIFAQNRKSEIVGIEKEFSVPIGKRILRGIIDRIDRLPDGHYEVIDYKTHAEIWNKERVDTDLQLTLYALGCKRALEIEPSVFSYFFLAHDQILSSVRTPEQEQAAVSELEAVAQKIEQQEFVPNRAACPRCDFKKSCKYSSLRAPAGEKKTNEK